jgi:hypothetical protein
VDNLALDTFPLAILAVVTALSANSVVPTLPATITALISLVEESIVSCICAAEALAL